MNKFLLTLLAVASLCALGCNESRKPVVVSLSPSASQTIDEGQSLSITAGLVNDSGSKGVSWTSSGPGSLTKQTSISVVYVAPSPAQATISKARPAATPSATQGSATVTATSLSDAKGTASLTISVTPSPLITTTALPDATEGSAYTQSIVATGGAGSLTYSLNSGSLPAGLALNSSSGAITGTPTGPAGTATFTIKVTDSSNAGPVSQASGTLTIKVVLPAGPSVTTASLPAGTVGAAYSQSVAATGGLSPLSFSISAGTLPNGLGIASSTGAISGTPTASGTFTFTVKVADSSTPTPQTATKQLSITVNPGLTITTTTLPKATVGAAYSQQLAYSSGTAPVAWSLAPGSALPAGLSLSSSGLIQGTPTATGSTSFTVQASDSSTPPQTAQQALSITVAASTAGLCDPSNTGSESLLNGQYIVILQGYNAVGPVDYGVMFDADGAGHIAKTVGILDTTANTTTPGPYNVAIDSAHSSYTLGADHRGCLNIATSGITLPLRFTVSSISSGVATRGHVIEIFIGDGEISSGTLLKQDTTAFSTSKLNGSYAFGISGPQFNQQKFGAVGVFHLDGSHGLTGQLDTNLGSELDSNGFTFPSAAISISAGSYSVAANGRGTLAFTPTGGSQSTAALYVLDSTSFLLLSTDLPSASGSLQFQGSAALQTGAPFSNASMNALSILGTSGHSTGATPGSVVRVGFLQPSATTGTLSYFYNDNGSGNTPPSVSVPVTMAVDGLGRGVVQNSGIGGIALLSLSSANHGYILFMVDPITKAADRTVSFGQFWQQTGAPFNDPTLGGGDWSFGSAGSDIGAATHTDGWAKFAANPSATGDIVTGNTDTANTSANLNTPYSQRFIINSATGAVSWTDSGLNNLAVGYIVSPKSIIAIDSLATTAPVLLYYEPQ